MTTLEIYQPILAILGGLQLVTLLGIAFALGQYKQKVDNNIKKLDKHDEILNKCPVRVLDH